MFFFPQYLQWLWALWVDGNGNSVRQTGDEWRRRVGEGGATHLDSGGLHVCVVPMIMGRWEKGVLSEDILFISLFRIKLGYKTGCELEKNKVKVRMGL